VLGFPKDGPLYLVAEALTEYPCLGHEATRSWSGPRGATNTAGAIPRLRSLLHHIITFLLQFSTYYSAFYDRISVTQEQRASEEVVTIQLVVYIGERLKNLRIRRALTQEELAANADIGKNTVNRIERNLAEPHMSTLRKLAQALGVEPYELLEGENDG
jgi:DNA-binding XRE family transcriptional regulator